MVVTAHTRPTGPPKGVTMNDKTKNTETDDTEGNHLKVGGIGQDAPTDDTEGNFYRWGDKA
jgi:hypothetical protein